MCTFAFVSISITLAVTLLCYLCSCFDPPKAKVFSIIFIFQTGPFLQHLRDCLGIPRCFFLVFIVAVTYSLFMVANVFLLHTFTLKCACSCSKSVRHIIGWAGHSINSVLTCNCEKSGLSFWVKRPCHINIILGVLVISDNEIIFEYFVQSLHLPLRQLRKITGTECFSAQIRVHGGIDLGMQVISHCFC